MSEVNCKICLNCVPKDTDEVASKNPQEWKFPDDFECLVGETFFPTHATLCDYWAVWYNERRDLCQ